jgi:putative transposase
MPSQRSVILATGEIYHIFNRGVERRVIFDGRHEYQHMVDLLDYYRFSEVPMRFSQFRLQSKTDQLTIVSNMKAKDLVRVEVLAYCLMPNHFHLMVKQVADHGISDFLSNICNSHSRYFNTKHERSGPLFQGPFKAVRVNTEEQLIHLSRYIHLNPSTAFLVGEDELDSYPWSSLPEYLSGKIHIIDPKPIMSIFKTNKKYQEFVHDNIDYTRTLGRIMHEAIDGEE